MAKNPQPEPEFNPQPEPELVNDVEPEPTADEAPVYFNGALTLDEGVKISAGLDSELRFNRKANDPNTGRMLVLGDDGVVRFKE